MESKSLSKKILGHKNIALVFVIIAVIVFFQIMNRNYLSIGNIRGILYAASLCGTIAVGMTCLLISGQIDLSVGAIGCLGGILVTIMLNAGFPWPAALLLTIICGGLLGSISAFLVNKLNLMAFIATLAMSSVYQGFARVFTDSQTLPIDNQSFWIIGSTTIAGIPLPFIITLALFVIFGVVLAQTRFGRRIYMCGGNSSAARLAGINTKRIHTILFINAGALSALGGAILAARMRSGSPIAVLGTDFDAITAAVLGGVAFTGGTGGMAGCFIGLLLLNIFNNGLTIINLQSFWTIVAQGALLILALTVDFLREKSRLKFLNAAH